MTESTRVFGDLSAMCEKEWRNLESREELFRSELSKILRLTLTTGPLSKDSIRYMDEMKVRRNEVVANGEGDL